ncbi:MAG: hypothetical protein WC335_03465 [Candidatus Omnitrophota bacterium]|jgi:hypothetical protein
MSKPWFCVLSFEFLISFVISILTFVIRVPANAEEITLLYTGDTHAMIYPCACPIEPDGGISRRATFIKEERQKNQNVLLLDSGGFTAGGMLDDYSQNAQLDMERTRINLKAIALMRYDALALGDDEFNFGEQFLAENIRPGDPVILSCNIAPKSYPGVPPVKLPGFIQPYVIKEIAGIKIGILGVTPLQAAQKAPDFKISDPKSAISRYVRELRGQQVDVVILLSHLGETEDQRLQIDIPGVDILIGGYGSYDKEPARKMGPGLFFLRCDRQARKISKAVVVLKDKKILDVKAEQCRLSDKVAADPEMEAVLPKCFYDYTCTQNGSSGLCVNAGSSASRCVFAPEKKISLEVIRPRDCATCKKSVESGVNFLSKYFPGVAVSYTDFPGKKARAVMQQAGVGTLPLYVFDKEIENEDAFEGIKDKFELHDTRYILKPGVGGISFYADREKVKGKLDLFISLFDPSAAAVLSLLKDYNPVVHFLASEQGEGFEAAKGTPEVEEYLRCACVQKYYPQNFQDYLICRAGKCQSSWWEDCTGNMDTGKIKTCAHGTEGAALLRENIKLNRDLQVMFGPAYLKDNQEIFASRGAPDKEELLKIIGKKK